MDGRKEGGREWNGMEWNGRMDMEWNEGSLEWNGEWNGMNGMEWKEGNGME